MERNGQPRVIGGGCICEAGTVLSTLFALLAADTEPSSDRRALCLSALGLDEPASPEDKEAAVKDERGVVGAELLE